MPKKELKPVYLVDFFQEKKSEIRLTLTDSQITTNCGLFPGELTHQDSVTSSSGSNSDEYTCGHDTCSLIM